MHHGRGVISSDQHVRHKTFPSVINSSRQTQACHTHWKVSRNQITMQNPMRPWLCDPLPCNISIRSYRIATSTVSCFTWRRLINPKMAMGPGGHGTIVAQPRLLIAQPILGPVLSTSHSQRHTKLPQSSSITQSRTTTPIRPVCGGALDSWISTGHRLLLRWHLRCIRPTILSGHPHQSGPKARWHSDQT